MKLQKGKAYNISAWLDSGVYVLAIGKLIYVGKAIDVSSRWSSHVIRLRKGDHSNKLLQRAVDELGIRKLKAALLLRSDPDSLVGIEGRVILGLRSEGFIIANDNSIYGQVGNYWKDNRDEIVDKVNRLLVRHD